MNNREYLQKYPAARPGTLLYRDLRAAKTAQLRQEVELAKYRSMTPLQRVLHYAGKIKELAGAWRA